MTSKIRYFFVSMTLASCATRLHNDSSSAATDARDLTAVRGNFSFGLGMANDKFNLLHTVTGAKMQPQPGAVTALVDMASQTITLNQNGISFPIKIPNGRIKSIFTNLDIKLEPFESGQPGVIRIVSVSNSETRPAEKRECSCFDGITFQPGIQTVKYAARSADTTLEIKFSKPGREPFAQFRGHVGRTTLSAPEPIEYSKCVTASMDCK